MFRDKNMERRIRPTADEGGISILTLLKCLLASFVITGVLLLLLAFVLFKVSLTEKIVTIVIILIYIVATFLAGLLAGKCIRTRRFIWGFVEGNAYFLILLILSLIMDASSVGLTGSLFTTYVLCAAGGTLGGMMS